MTQPMKARRNLSSSRRGRGTQVHSSTVHIAILILFAACLLPAVAFGQEDDFWKGPSKGLWRLSTNWSDGIPTASNDVVIEPASGPATVILNGDGAAGNLKLGTDNVLMVSNGTLNMGSPGSSVGSSTINNDGRISIDNTAAGAITSLNLNGNLTLEGTGTLVLSNNSGNVIGAAASGLTLTNSQLIQGGGTIGSGSLTLENNGTIDVNEQVPLNITGIFTNNGTVKVQKGSRANVTGTFTNLNGNGTLTGGILNITGTLQLNGSVLTNAGNLTLNGSGAIVDPNGNALTGLTTIANAGTLVLNGSTLTLSGNLINNGTLTINGSILTLNGGTLTLNGTLIGMGTINGNLTSAGTIAPGTTFMKPGTLSVKGDVSLKRSGGLHISVRQTAAGSPQNGRLSISDAAKLDGTLNIDLIDGYVPPNDTSFEIVAAGRISGMFDKVNINNSDVEATVNYSSSNVTVLLRRK
jgi:hypothetical protein